MSEPVNPDDFVISRKRKKYKFALFANAALAYEFDEWDAAWQPTVVEVGSGTGEFLAQIAARHSDEQYVAIDVKGDRLQRGARNAETLALTNIRFLRARADQLVDIFRPTSLHELWLTFSDPFPRRHSAGRRLTHPRQLAQYAQLLAPHGSLIIKHDDPGFFQWSLEQLITNDWRLVELSFDLHDSDLADDYKILTDYEAKWLDEGKRIQFARLRPPKPVS